MGEANNCCTSNSVSKHALGLPQKLAIAGSLVSTSKISQSTDPTNTGSPSPTTSLGKENPTPLNYHKNSIVKVGVGVGVPLSVLLIFSVGGAAWWIKKKEKSWEARETKLNAKIAEQDIVLGSIPKMEAKEYIWHEMEAERGVELQSADHRLEMV